MGGALSQSYQCIVIVRGFADFLLSTSFFTILLLVMAHRWLQHSYDGLKFPI